MNEAESETGWLNVHLCPTFSPLPLWWASIIQSMVGGQGRKTNRRHVASRSKTAEINAPADTTAVCLSHNRVHTLGPNTAARPQTARQALTLRSSMSQPCDKTRLLAVNMWISPVRRGWVQIFLHTLGEHQRPSFRFYIFFLSLSFFIPSRDGISLPCSCGCLKANNWLVKCVLLTQK